MHESHAQLLDDRRTLQAVEAALGDLRPVPQESGDTLVGPLARRLGIRPATRQLPLIVTGAVADGPGRPCAA